MTLSAAASFAPLTNGPVQLAALLGTTFGLAATVSLTTWCAAGRALALVWTNRAWHTRNITLASILLASIFPMWMN